MIAGAGFSMMAWTLAQDRRWFKGFSSGPLERHEVGRLDGPSVEYYRITDRAEHLWHFRDHEWASVVSL